MNNILDVKLIPVAENPKNGELSDKIYYECMFCGKRVGLYPNQRRLCETLSGHNFYCIFCLRNNFNTNNNRNILILSFRAIVGYYYYTFYLNSRKMYYSQIEDYINIHIKTGLENPVFYYDNETMLWFIDFSKVGRGNKKIKICEIFKTITNIITCFNLDTNLGNNKSCVLYDKYKEAIEKFYTSRWRPDGKRMLLPTLQGCESSFTKPATFEETRCFTISRFVSL